MLAVSSAAILTDLRILRNTQYLQVQISTGVKRVDIFLRIIPLYFVYFFFFFNDPAPTEFYPFSLHDPLPISIRIPARPAPGHSPRAGYPRWWGGPSAHGFADAISAGADR